MKYVMFQDLKSNQAKPTKWYLTKQQIITPWMNAPRPRHGYHEQADLWWIVKQTSETPGMIRWIRWTSILNAPINEMIGPQLEIWV